MPETNASIQGLIGFESRISDQFVVNVGSIEIDSGWIQIESVFKSGGELGSICNQFRVEP